MAQYDSLCFGAYYESVVKYGQENFVLEPETENSPTLDIFYRSRMNGVIAEMEADLPSSCPARHGKLELDVIYKNSAGLVDYAANGNRYVLYMQFEDPSVVGTYDGLFFGHLLDSAVTQDFVVAGISSDTLKLVETSSVVTGYEYEDFIVSESDRWIF